MNCYNHLLIGSIITCVLLFFLLGFFLGGALGKPAIAPQPPTLASMRGELNTLTNIYNGLSTPARNSEIGREVLRQMHRVDADLRRMQEKTMGEYRRPFGNYDPNRSTNRSGPAQRPGNPI